MATDAEKVAEFVELSAPDERLPALFLLASRHYERGDTVLIYAPGGDAAEVDKYFWTCRQNSFIPHAQLAAAEEPLAPRNVQERLVDAQRLDHGREAVEDREDPLADLAVSPTADRQYDRMRAQPQRRRHRHGRPTAVDPRLVARRAHHPPARRVAAHQQALADQRRVIELLDGREKLVHVHMKNPPLHAPQHTAPPSPTRPPSPRGSILSRMSGERPRHASAPNVERRT